MSNALSDLVEFQEKRKFKRPSSEILILLGVIAVCALAYHFRPGDAAPPAEAEVVKASTSEGVLQHSLVKADVQMALILDTSASMDGLIRQAREQILQIASDLQTDENGKKRTLSLALYRYGSSGASSDSGYIQCLVPLTTDHTSTVEALGWLRAAGSEEYAPMAISTAVQELAWDPDPHIPKVIVVVGNETFSAGPIGIQEAMDLAKSKKIRVLPIYCVGDQASTTAVAGWRRAAGLAGTELITIDPNLVLAELEKPIDKAVYVELAKEAEKQEKLKDEAEPLPLPRRIRKEAHFPGYESARSMKVTAPRAADFRTGVSRGMQSVLKTY